MNTQTFAIGTKRLIVGLLAISALGAIALPVRADEAIIQESRQESINTGEGNTSVQNSNQESRIRNSRDGYRRYDDDSTGVVQTNDQFCDQLGEDNVCAQNTDQRTNIRQRRDR
ncbi:conserved hypothetical protein [Hyella patelloides LEGE 07179]|uniref:Uncharacterized protein n=1 Tax=Hyella patelloides LEGE 07179 TaxID=945734 RepID=A0A563VVD6_9CYAN|nr:hypothetical protein [Hyella patelloides]VEP15370.1 conserved hypothetical protein [Hyella patelloides LEGE 07179]